MTSLFGASVPQTQLTLAIEKATSETQSPEDVQLHMDICDMINETDSGPKDAAKALKKKLGSKASTGATVKALIVLETCVKNCGKRFHHQVTSKDFVATLGKLLEQKNQSTLIRERVLNIVQSWAAAFRSDPAAIAVCQLHQELLLKHVEFPAQNLDEMAPIFTPDRSVEPNSSSGDDDAALATPPPDSFVPRMSFDNSHQFTSNTSVYGNGTNFPAPAPSAAASQPPHSGSPAAATPATAGRGLSQVQIDEEYARQLAQQFDAEDRAAQRQAQAAAHPPAAADQVTIDRPVYVSPGQRHNLSASQLTKLRKDLAVVTNNAAMLKEMVQALGPTDRISDGDVLLDLHVACEEMRTRLLTLAQTVENPEVLDEVLKVNDKVAEALQLYDAAVQARQGTVAPASASSVEYTDGQYQTFSPPSEDTASSSSQRGVNLGHDAGESSTDAVTTAMSNFDPFRQYDGTTFRDSMNRAPGYATAEDMQGTSGLGSAVYSPRSRSNAPSSVPSAGQEEPDLMESSSVLNPPRTQPLPPLQAPLPPVQSQDPPAYTSEPGDLIDMSQQSSSLPTPTVANSHSLAGTSSRMVAGQMTDDQRERMEAMDNHMFGL